MGGFGGKLIAAVVATLIVAAPARAAETLYFIAGNNVWVAPADKLGSAFVPVTAITGLAPSDQAMAIDLRPADGKVYLLAANLTPSPDQLNLYTLDPLTGVATLINTAVPMTSPAANNTFSYWMDFNPVADRIRVIGADGSNFRVNPSNGTLITPPDTAVAFAPGDATSGTPFVRGVAYDNSVAGATSSTAYAWHLPMSPSGAPVPLLRIGGPGGTPSPNGGQLNTIGQTGLTNLSGAPLGLDVSGFSGTAYGVVEVFNGFTSNTTVGTLNLTSGKYTALPSFSAVGATEFTIAPSGALGLSAATISHAENGGDVTVTVNRTGSTAGTFTVDYATNDGSATAGADYTATTGTLTFAAGETSKTFSVPVTDDSADEGRESFTVELSSPTGNAQAGAILARHLATVVLEDNDAPVVPPPTPPDTTKPTLTIAGAPASLTRTKFLKGFTITLTPSEPASFDITLEGKTSKATLASIKTTLFSKHLKLAATAQKVKVKPNRKGVGRVTQKRKVTLRVYATDAAGNRSTASTKTITVKPDPKKKRG